MATDLKVQSYYHVAFSSPWTDLDCDVKVTGMTSISTLSDLMKMISLKLQLINSSKLSTISMILLQITLVFRYRLQMCLQLNLHWQISKLDRSSL